jgi:hypothetical protein
MLAYRAGAVCGGRGGELESTAMRPECLISGASRLSTPPFQDSDTPRRPIIRSPLHQSPPVWCALEPWNALSILEPVAVCSPLKSPSLSETRACLGCWAGITVVGNGGRRLAIRGFEFCADSGNDAIEVNRCGSERRSTLYAKSITS